MFTQYLQEAFQVPLVIQLTDDEKALWRYTVFIFTCMLQDCVHAATLHGTYKHLATMCMMNCILCAVLCICAYKNEHLIATSTSCWRTTIWLWVVCFIGLLSRN